MGEAPGGEGAGHDVITRLGIHQSDWSIASTDRQAIRRASTEDMATDQSLGYGIKCEPDMSYSSDYFQTPPNFLQDSIPEGNEDGMDFSGLLEMDDKALSGKGQSKV